MAWSFAVAPTDVLEVTISHLVMDQLVQQKFDIRIGGTGVGFTSDQVLDQIATDWTFNFASKLTSLTKHVQTRLQMITDCVISTVSNRPTRIRTLLDKRDRTPTMDGTILTAAAPIDVTASVQLITTGAPRQFWGRKSFSQLPVASLAADGETLAPASKNAWELDTTAMFATTHAIATTTLNYVIGVLPTTYVANLAQPHGAMSGYFFGCVGTYVGTYVGSMATRRVNPNSLLGH